MVQEKVLKVISVEHKSILRRVTVREGKHLNDQVIPANPLLNVGAGVMVL